MTHIERLKELLRRYVGSDDMEDMRREAIIKPIAARWPGFSGNRNYPVEGYGAYWRNYGRARRDLRLFIIAELQRMLADETGLQPGLQPGLHSQPDMADET